MYTVNEKVDLSLTANSPREKMKDTLLSLTEDELNEVFTYMVKRGYIKLERE